MNKSHNRTVIVTGMGMVNSLGHNTREVWNALVDGQSGVCKTETEITGDAGAWLATTKAFEADPFVLESKASKLFQRCDHMGATAALEAVRNAGLEKASAALDAAGLFTASGKEETPVDLFLYALQDCLVDGRIDHRLLGEIGARRVNPLSILEVMPNTGMFGLSAILGIRGPGSCYVSGSVAGAQSVSDASAAIQNGACVTALAGGADSRLDLFNIACLELEGGIAMGVQESFNSPFTPERAGYALGEGAAYLILERSDVVQSRNTEPLACISGYASTYGDGSTSISAAVRDGLTSASVTPPDIDAVIANGLGTQESDREEAAAIYETFGDRAAELPVCAIKPATGNMFPASSVSEIAFAAMAVNTGTLPPTYGFTEPDRQCGLYGLSNEARSIDLRHVLCLTVGLNGQCSATVVSSV